MWSRFGLAVVHGWDPDIELFRPENTMYDDLANNQLSVTVCLDMHDNPNGPSTESGGWLSQVSVFTGASLAVCVIG